MGKIAVPIAFFRKERKTVYGEWRTAFWRELLANSIDAGADEIRIKMENGYVRFSDNGPGMTKSVCENVYLRLGETTKGGEADGTGGFGRARILTCFSMDRYRIRTQDYTLTGSGADYEIEPLPASGPTRFYGFNLEVEDAELNKVLIARALEKVLVRCNIPHVSIFVNEERLSVEPYQRLEPAPLELPFGTMSVEKGRGDVGNEILVRVNGLVMFHKWHPGLQGHAVLVELNASTSREHLTASRDGGKPEFDEAVGRVLKMLAQQGKEALTKKVVDKRVMFTGASGFNTSIEGKAPVGTELGSSETSVFSNLLASLYQRYDHGAVEHQGCHLGYRVSTSSEELITIAEAWNPDVWLREPASSHLEKWQLIAAWEAALEQAWKAYHLAKPRDTDPKFWAIGLTFTSALAEMAEVNGGWDSGYLFSVNPVRQNDNYEYELVYPDLLDFKYARRLFAAAMHEVAHVVSDEHDESFARGLTFMLAETDQAEAVFSVISAARRVKKLIRGK